MLLVQSTNLPGNLFFSFIDFLSNFFIFDKSVLNKARSINISITFNDSLLLLFNHNKIWFCNNSSNCFCNLGIVILFFVCPSKLGELIKIEIKVSV